MVDATQVLQFFANGVSFGAILALAAIGLSLVYGILNLSNFAHGDFVALGAFVVLIFGKLLYDPLPLVAVVLSLTLLALLGVDTLLTKRLSNAERGAAGAFAVVTLLMGAWALTRGMGGNVAAEESTAFVLALATLVAVASTCTLLVLLEFLIWRPLRRQKATTLTLIIVSIGLSLVVRNALLHRFGGGNHSFNRPGIPADRIFGVLVTDAQQFTLLATLVAIAAVHAFLRYTKAGKAMRALADNPELARVTGIDVERMIVYVWIITGTLVTLAGLLLSLVQNNSMNANMGFSIIIALFASVIVGGIGSAYGAMLGGFVVGIAMKTSALWLGTQYELASAFIILIIVLIVRPQGILGVKI